MTVQPVPPLAASPAELAVATARVSTDLAGIDRPGVAFSGGVDSSVLLALAARVLGTDQVVALLGVSPSLAAAERRGAHRVARRIGVDVVEVETKGVSGRPIGRTGRIAATTASTSCSPPSTPGSPGPSGWTPSRTGRTPTTWAALIAPARAPPPSTT